MNLNYLMAFASRKLHTKISLHQNGKEAQSVCKNLELAEQFELSEECTQKILRYSNKAVPHYRQSERSPCIWFGGT